MTTISREWDSYLNGNIKFKVILHHLHTYLSASPSSMLRKLYWWRKQNENFPKKTSPVSRTITTIDEEKAILLRYDCNATTFQGLERVIKCVDAYVNQLTFIMNNVNECARYLIEEIKLFLTNFYIDSEII